MALLELTLLGGFSAQMPAQQAVKVSSRKNQALLAFLALTPGRRHAREKLVDLFWGDRDNDHGRNSLRQALTALRKDLTAIDPTPMTIEGEILSVRPAAIDVDVLAFERLSGSDSINDLKQAAALYRGDLLAGLALEESSFAEWLDPERHRFREMAIDVFTRLIPNLVGKEAVEAARRLVELDPLRETSHRILIGLLAEQGETEMALKHYRDYGEALERELGLKPSAAAQALYKEICAGRPSKDGMGGHNAGERHASAVSTVRKLERRLAEKPLIAILPFENRSTEANHQFFCDSLVDDISDAISRVTSFLVIAGASTANYRGKAVDLRAIGSELGAAYVLQGSVHRLGERLRISTQLSDVGRGIHLWAEQYQCSAQELADMQDTIVRAVAASTETQIEIAGRYAKPAGLAGGLAVYDLVARGNSLLYDETPESFAEAVALGEQAVALEPREPSAHLLRAEAFVYRLAARAVEIDAEKVARGIELSQAALRMAPDQEWAHLALARAYVEAEQLDAAIAECERALELNPSVSNAIARLGECYALQGRHVEAIDACRLALKLNPRSPTNYWRQFSIAVAHFAAGNDAEALREASLVLMRRPDFVRAAAIVAAAGTALGRKPEAEAALARCLLHYPDLRAGQAVPRIMPRFSRPADRGRLAGLLHAAGLPE